MKPFCSAPYVGLVIDPNFNIQMCCTDGTRHLNTNLRDIDSLHEFFYNGEKYSNLRKDFESYNLLDYAACFACHRSTKGFTTEIDNYNERFRPTTIPKLRQLEVTTSNVCNQTCVMCTPYFSSSHVKLHKIGKVMTMSDNDLNKVYKVLPDIEILRLKGGEPFADQNNAKILEELYRVNPDVPTIYIISNGTNISKRFKNILTKFKNVQILFSVDGANKVYEWQRGSSYVKTVNSINAFYKDTGITYGIISAITVYNFPSVAKDVKQYYNDFIGLTSVDVNNVVWEPAHVSASLYDVDILFKMLSNIKRDKPKPFSDTDIKYYSDRIFSIHSYSTDEFAKYHKQFVEHTNFYNKVRGFNILNHVPELKDVYNATI